MYGFPLSPKRDLKCRTHPSKPSPLRVLARMEAREFGNWEAGVRSP